MDNQQKEQLIDIVRKREITEKVKIREYNKKSITCKMIITKLET